MTTIISERKPLIKVSTIRKDEELGNISVAIRRLLAYEIPDRIFEIHIIDGIANTSVCDYITLEWENCFVIGEAIDVAITFDGHWQRGSLDKLVLITDELPYIFWVDADNALYEQVWDIDSTRQLLATEVIKVKAIRAWKNVNFPNLDHGLVVAYIKTDGKVYYRNYCQQADGSLVWELEREVTQFTGIAVNLNLFITNDYRTGIIIQDNQGKIHWLITSRNWAGMAIAPQVITVAPCEVAINFIPLDYVNSYEEEYLSVAPTEILADLLFANTDNEILSIVNVPVTMLDENNEEYEDWGWVIEFRVKNPIPNLTLSEAVFTSVETGVPIGMASIELVEGNLYKVTVDDVVESGINDIYGDIRLTITGAVNPAGYSYVTMTKDFTPINLVPKFIPLPEVEAIWNE